MSYIREIEPDDAPEEVSRIYDRLRERFEGRVPNVLKVVSLRPRAMEALFELNMAVTFGGSGLTRVQEEAIATAVSAINHCEYWTAAHGEFLRQHSGDEDLALSVMRDHHKAHLDPPTRALLDYAEKLTVAPSTMGREDIAALRAAGLSDEQILDATLIACMFNFMDRLADGLGVEIPAPRLNLLRRAWGADPATESPPDKIRS